MRLRLPCFLLGLFFPFFCVAGEARVTRVEVLTRTPIASASGIPAYEKITARVYFAVKPSDAHNSAIVDLNKASQNGQGEVEFSSDLLLLRPVTGGNGALLLEIPNRGGSGLLSLVDGGSWNPTDAAHLGDGWLLRRGFTFAALGWQWDVASDTGLRLYAPVAYERGGTHITGLLRDDYTPAETSTDVPLGHIMGPRLGGTEYPAAAPEDARNVLTVRDSPHGQRKVIPRSEWSFAHAVHGALTPSDRFLHLNAGFVPGRIYELVYVVQDPVVAGLGFAAVRDFSAWMKHPAPGEPETMAPVKFVYAAGISQCGRFLRDFLYEGFNADASDRMVLDGVLAHVGGGGRGSFNYRFAQPSRDAQPMSSIDWPTDIFPFTDQLEADPDHPQNGRHGLLNAAIEKHVAPKIFFSHTSYEYWGRAASLIHTTADGQADAAPGENVRIYFYAGLQHFSVAFPPAKAAGDRDGQQLPSPLPIRWFWRAMIANMDAWVQHGTAPPASRYPRIADGTLTRIAKLHFPAIPGLKPPQTAAQGEDLDFGPNWRAGILSQQPPKLDGSYLTLVPQVDEDGNDLGGIRLPEMVVPLATYTGWNLRTAAIGAPGERTAFLGSFVPLHRTAADAAAAHDPRQPIESRYENFERYRASFEQAVDGLIREGYLLPEDRAAQLERARQEWDWITSYKPAE